MCARIKIRRVEYRRSVNFYNFAFSLGKLPVLRSQSDLDIWPISGIGNIAIAIAFRTALNGRGGPRKSARTGHCRDQCSPIFAIICVYIGL